VVCTPLKASTLEMVKRAALTYHPSPPSVPVKLLVAVGDETSILTVTLFGASLLLELSIE
jgi:hypothetical protein